MASGFDSDLANQLPQVRALFQQRFDGDDALLRLAALRFRQAGLAAEVYADTLDQLERVLTHVPPHRHTPVVHLSRGIDVLDERGRATVEEFAHRFAGRVWGLVFHDRRSMVGRAGDVVDAMRLLDVQTRSPDAPYLFLEYAAGVEPEVFVGIGEDIVDSERVSMCIDIGHVGIEQARRSFSRRHPDLDLAALTSGDLRLIDLIDDIRAATAAALPTVLEVTRRLGGLGKPVHFHLHDGHPLIPGLSDHVSFLAEVNIPFAVDGRWSLPLLYGPSGLARIIRTACEACPGERASFTLEIYQAEGRLPLGDAAGLFRHWRDVTNAERMNYLQSVLAANNLLVRSILAEGWGGSSRRFPQADSPHRD